eukprot:GHVU01211143.1.p1 GENE.GHVU01211143.1~~GHVU01211143.1.p1  ORF type:complete len:532 (+),score=90.99 GHVU01211143.1:322-1917(+)
MISKRSASFDRSADGCLENTGLRSSSSSAGGTMFEWREVRALGTPPTQRSLHSAVVVGNRMYVIGGYDGHNRVDEFHCFDYDTRRWTSVPVNSDRSPSAVGPPPRDRLLAVSHDLDVYVFGGYDGTRRVNDLWRFSTVECKWALCDPGGDLPSPRHSHCGVTFHDYLYIFAGYDGTFKNDVFRYHYSEGEWEEMECTGELPTARYRPSMVLWSGRAYVYGGHNGKEHLADLHELNLETHEWSLVKASGTIPEPRDSHVAVVYRDSMFVHGGSSGAARGEVLEFRFFTQTWVQVDAKGSCMDAGATAGVASPRFCHTGVLYDSRLYIFGGYDGVKRLSDLKELRLDADIEIPDSTLAKDLEEAVLNSAFSDVTFLVEGREVPAHKLLCARSAYFRAMFNSQMCENHAGMPIEIPGVTYDVFKSVLTFLYTDTLVLLGAASRGSPSLSSSSSLLCCPERYLELLEAADMFCVERMKVICEQTLVTLISPENVCAFLEVNGRVVVEREREAGKQGLRRASSVRRHIIRLHAAYR